MARPLRIEFAGALYHVTARGNERRDIFFADDDRLEFLATLGEVCTRFNWCCHAFCQMTNHYHLLVETPAKGEKGTLPFIPKGEKGTLPFIPVRPPC